MAVYKHFFGAGGRSSRDRRGRGVRNWQTCPQSVNSCLLGYRKGVVWRKVSSFRNVKNSSAWIGHYCTAPWASPSCPPFSHQPSNADLANASQTLRTGISSCHLNFALTGSAMDLWPFRRRDAWKSRNLVSWSWRRINIRWSRLFCSFSTNLERHTKHAYLEPPKRQTETTSRLDSVKRTISGSNAWRTEWWIDYLFGSRLIISIIYH